MDSAIHHKWIYKIVFIIASGIMLGQGRAQDVAVFTAIEGTVTVQDQSGETTPAILKLKLREGHQIATGDDGRAQVLFYTGEEKALEPGQTFRVEKKTTDDSFLSNLGNTLSGLLWGKESAGAIAGATRTVENRKEHAITAVYPAETKILEKLPVFQWIDRRAQPGTTYVVTIRSDISDFKFEIPVEQGMQTAYPAEAPALEPHIPYVWSVKDAEQEVDSAPVHFSLMHPEDIAILDEELDKIKEVCGGDTLSTQWRVLATALYWEFRLMRQAEKNILALLEEKPHWNQGRMMLANLYRATGRMTEAKSQEALARGIE